MRDKRCPRCGELRSECERFCDACGKRYCSNEEGVQTGADHVFGETVQCGKCSDPWRGYKRPKAPEVENVSQIEHDAMLREMPKPWRAR